MKRLNQCVVVVSVVVVGCFLVYYVIQAVEAVRNFPERHAKGCLVTITQLADRTVDRTIPEGRYTDAIDAADYISTYYPPGMVLPEDHPFAAKYSEERSKQISRITTALKEATGMDYGHNWKDWKNAFASQHNSVQ